MMRSKARKLRELIERGARSLTDSEALTGIELYPAWNAGISYTVGERVRYEDKLYKVIQAHTSLADWAPPLVPALFIAIAPPGEIPDWVQPTGAHDAYQIGDKVSYKGAIWECEVANNAYPPDVYGWHMVEEVTA